MNTQQLLAELEAAEQKAWASLARYNFLMFGYWAVDWELLNNMGDFQKPNPFRALVRVARSTSKRAWVAADAPTLSRTGHPCRFCGERHETDEDGVTQGVCVEEALEKGIPICEKDRI